jgi:hypothetical protein
VKRSSNRVAVRIRVLTVFAAAFISGAFVIFGAASLVGAAFRAAGLPTGWRLGLVAAGLLALALLDLLAIRRGRYCPLGLRRQTPKTLSRRYAVTTVVACWGFDTGLAVTTFRVAAVTWAALLMAGLGLSAWWAGLGYGMGFVLPLMFFILMQPPEQPAAPSTVGLTLEGLLRKRPAVQSASAVMLLTASGVLLLHLLAR